jgi:hypothetical protein
MEILNEILSDNIGYLNALRHAQQPIIENVAKASVETAEVVLKKSGLPYLLIGIGIVGLIIIIDRIVENNRKKNQIKD